MKRKRAIEELGHGESRLASGHGAFGDGTVKHVSPVGVARKRNGNLKSMQWVSTHHHTTYSYGDGFQLPSAHFARAAELNMGMIFITEHGNISSHVKAEVAAAKQGLRCGFGCELYMVESLADNTQKKFHLTVLAKNQIGYQNLLMLVSKSYAEGFFHEPTVDLEMLVRHKEGLVILSGCQGSLLHCSATGGKLIDVSRAGYKRARKVAAWFKHHFDDDYYIEVQAFPQLEKTCLFNPIAERMGRVLGIGLVATRDIHYTIPAEAEVQKILHNVRPGEKRTLEDMERDWGYDVPLCPPISDLNIYHDLRYTGLSKEAAWQAIGNTALIGDACRVTLPRLPMLRYPLPRGYIDEKELLYDWLREGWRYRELDKMPHGERMRYKAILRKELDVIEQKGFISYFLLNSDAVKYAKDQGIPVGPARGSAAASLVCWLLRITEVNPVLFPNLVFERFIDVSRADLPDIDLDFPAWGRETIRDYLVGKYGENAVGNIGTFTNYKARLAIDDVAKVHHIPAYAAETVKELLIERSSGDLRASATIADTIEHFDAAAAVVKQYPDLSKASDLEGNVKTFGVHAAGLVVANGDIREVCALYQKVMDKGTRDERTIQVVSMDKYDAERQNLLKLDYLALSTLDMITYCLDEIGMTLEELYAIPLEDPEIIDGFRENDCVGVFQFDGRAARSVNRALKPDTFVEICDVIALCRPGPLHSGAAGDYIDTKWGRRKRESLHPALDGITAATHGQIVYQEQILRVVTEIGAFDWTSASAIRRIMSKKEGSAKFNAAWKDFWAGARTLHKRGDYPRMVEEVARYIWNRLITAGAYAFNFAHCVSYGMIGAWVMWLKRHYPEVFYAGALAHLPEGKNKTPSQWDALKLDAVQKGIDLRPPNPRRPTKTWRPAWSPSDDGYSKKDGYIRAGLIEISGIGENIAPLMIEYGKIYKPRAWSEYLAVRGVGNAKIQALVEMEMSDDPFGVKRLPRMLRGIEDQLSEWGLPEPTHTAAEIPYSKGQDVEVCWMGIVTKRNLKDIFESHRAKTGEELDPANVKQPELREQVVFTCYDGTEVCTVRFDRFRYPKFKKAVWKVRPDKDVILVRGVKPRWRDAREIYANEIWIIDPED